MVDYCDAVECLPSIAQMADGSGKRHLSHIYGSIENRAVEVAGRD